MLLELFPLPPALVVGSEARLSQATPLCCSSKSPSVNSGVPLELTSPPAAPCRTLPKQLWRNTTKRTVSVLKSLLLPSQYRRWGFPMVLLMYRARTFCQFFFSKDTRKLMARWML